MQNVIQKTALVVEDEPETRRLVAIYLSRMGLKVHEVPDGRSAIAFLDQHHVDIVVLDLMLPEYNGYEICEHVRKSQHLANVPVVMMSARGLPSDRAAAEEIGASAYIIKPFTHADFTARIGSLLGRRKGDRT